MKTLIVVAAFLMVSLPAHAQRAAAPAAARGGFSNLPGSNAAGMNSGGGFGGGGGSVAFPGLSASQPFSPASTVVHGSDSYSPSVFMPYAKAIKAGLAALAYRPKTVAEVAAEVRAARAKKSS